MTRTSWRALLEFLVMLLAMANWSLFASSQTATQGEGDSAAASLNVSEVLTKLDQLVEQNGQLEKQNRELMDQIQSLRRVLAQESGAKDKAIETETEPAAMAITNNAPQEKPQADGDLSTPEEPKRWGTYTPNQGFKLADTEYGDLNLSIYTYVRYLNQLGLDPTYTDAFGNVKTVQQRQDMQIQKVQIKFLGWLLNLKFRYFLYAWTSNASQGLPAQVVLAGNVNYTFNKHFNLAGGITSLPGTRSVEGNFPFWLGVDTRLIADEFFRPSYTSGIWARFTWGGSTLYGKYGNPCDFRAGVTGSPGRTELFGGTPNSFTCTSLRWDTHPSPSRSAALGRCSTQTLS